MCLFIWLLFFFLEKKEPKIQDLETLAKILNNSLKSPKLGRIGWFEFLTLILAALQTMEIF
jgi:hypothetical protein